MVSRHDFCAYAAGYADEEDLRVEVRGAVVGGEARGRLTAPGDVEGWGRVRVYACNCVVYETYFECMELCEVIF